MDRPFVNYEMSPLFYLPTDSSFPSNSAAGIFSIVIQLGKTKLQEFSLKKYKKLPLYNVMSSIGPRHIPTYKISVSITGSKKFIGIGSSKQQAELDGAAKLLKAKNIK